jgi:hypothetical protein
MVYSMKCNGMLVVLIFVVLSSTVRVQTSVQFGFLLRTHTENFTSGFFSHERLQRFSLQSFSYFIEKLKRQNLKCHDDM